MRLSSEDIERVVLANAAEMEREAARTVLLTNGITGKLVTEAEARAVAQDYQDSATASLAYIATLTEAGDDA